MKSKKIHFLGEYDSEHPFPDEIDLSNLEIREFLDNLHNYHQIKTLASQYEYYSYLEEIGLKRSVLDDLFLFTITPEKEELYYQHYLLILEQNPHHNLQFSFIDFALAYMAAENGYGIISLDHHLLNVIQQFLEYDAFYPDDLVKNDVQSDGIFLLDTNILLALHWTDEKHTPQIKCMFQKHNLTFLIAEPVLRELKNVLQKFPDRLIHPGQANLKPESSKDLSQNHMLSFSHSNKSNTVVLDEQYLEFIDDFEAFESTAQKRRDHKKMKRSHHNYQKKSAFIGDNSSIPEHQNNSNHSNPSMKNSNNVVWTVAKRYRKLFDNLY